MAKKGKSSASHVLGTILGVILSICLIPLILVNVLLIKSHLTYKDGPPRVQGRGVFLLNEKVPKKAEKGDLVISIPSKNGKYKKGEYVAFIRPVTNEIAVRRIVEERHSVEEGAIVYEMEKNDKGEIIFISADEILGTCNFRFAPAGEVVTFLNTGMGIVLAVLIPLLWFVLATKSKGERIETSDPPKPEEVPMDFDIFEDPPLKLGQHKNTEKWNVIKSNNELIQGRVLKEEIPEYSETDEDPYENQLEECREMFKKADRLEEKKPSSLKLDPEKLEEAEKDPEREKAIKRLEKSKSVDLLKDEIPEPLKEEPVREIPEPLKEEPMREIPEPLKEEPMREIPEPLKEEPVREITESKSEMVKGTPEPLKKDTEEKPVIEELLTVEDDFLAVHRETIRMLEELKAAEEAHLKRIREERNGLTSSTDFEESLRPSKRQRASNTGGQPVKVKPRKVYGYSKRGADNEEEK